MAADLILGIKAYHADAAACLVSDSKLLAAVEDERFRRVELLQNRQFKHCNDISTVSMA